jgi:hypothetical protein
MPVNDVGFPPVADVEVIKVDPHTPPIAFTVETVVVLAKTKLVHTCPILANPGTPTAPVLAIDVFE